ncbi:MAG: glycosyltransferase [Syntrophales bacterium]
MRTRRVEQYLARYGVQQVRPLVAGSLEGIEQAVVIPALAERSSLFRTLASLAGNPADDLRRTLVVCVVNNHRHPLTGEEEIGDNRDTLAVLADIVSGSSSSSSRWADIGTELRKILRSELRTAFIDASSPGREIPDRDGGVGTARKIGMDAALGIIGRGGDPAAAVCCLDSDTLVDENYLPAVRAHFAATGNPAAVVAYAHQIPADAGLRAAICCYELFLRSYVIGLSFAGSPYAFHAIGSTMACSAEGYVGVRGMNRRGAAEDFHFLNKIAKTGTIGQITATTVTPSARTSHRVPFGTGQRMRRFIAGGSDEYRIYAPPIFIILREWIAAFAAAPDRDGEAILAEAGAVHGRLAEYLRLCRFSDDWRHIRDNCRDPRQLRRQFHLWFDGLRTLRLVHHLGRHEFPPVPMFAGLAQLFSLFGLPFPEVRNADDIPHPDDQYGILSLVRSAFPRS